jgi:hypothetical protein
MGTLFYGAARHEVPFEDRVLAHLQIVMTAKLRRTEGFILSWTAPTSSGSGRQMIWITPSTDLHYKFSGNTPPAINRTWLEEMAVVSNSTHGLYVTEEGALQPLAATPE